MLSSGIWHLIQWVHYLALALWIGGITFLSAVAAPAAHHSIVSRAVAGQIVARILKRLNMVEIVSCTLLMATSLLSYRFVREKAAGLWVLIAVVAVMGSITSFYSFYLTPRLEEIKEKVPTLDALSKGHPSKLEFNRLHQMYVRLMGVNLILGLVVLYLSVVFLK